MKRQVEIIWNIGVYAGDLRRVDFDVAARMIANGTALVVGAEPRLHRTGRKPRASRARPAMTRSSKAGKAPQRTEGNRGAPQARSKR
jgi:hypothetical protein